MKRNFLFSVRLTPKRSLIGILVACSLTFITVKCKINQDDLLKFYNEIRKGMKFGLLDSNSLINEIDNQLNQKINKNPEILDFKIRGEVNDALWNYEKKEIYIPNMKNQNILEEINKPKYNELQRKIIKDAVYYEFADGTMGIRGAWVPPDPREIPLE